MPFIETDGGLLHYRFDGPAEAPVLLLSNSLGTDLSMWDGQVAAFAQHFRVLRYDSRGHGASAVTQGPYTIGLLGRDAIGLLDGLEIGRAHFCGLSMGGLTGMWLASHAPDRLDRLVLCNTAARIGSQESWDARIEAVRAGGMAAIVPAVLARFFSAPFLDQAPEAVECVRRVLARTDEDGYCACCAAIRAADLRDTLDRVHVPTLVIAGTHDAATPPADGQWLAERIPGTRYVELMAAHLSNVEAAQQFNDAVRRFLTE